MKHIDSPLVVFGSGTQAFYGDRHRYFLKHGNSLLKLQVRGSIMEEFLQTKKGLQCLQLVDILAQGGGWYEVTSKDFSNLDFLEAVGGKRLALPLFLRSFNTWVLPQATVKVAASNDEAVEPARQISVVGTATRKVVRSGNTLVMPRVAASSSKLQALAQKFMH